MTFLLTGVGAGAAWLLSRRPTFEQEGNYGGLNTTITSSKSLTVFLPHSLRLDALTKEYLRYHQQQQPNDHKQRDKQWNLNEHEHRHGHADKLSDEHKHKHCREKEEGSSNKHNQRHRHKANKTK